MCKNFLFYSSVILKHGTTVFENSRLFDIYLFCSIPAEVLWSVYSAYLQPFCPDASFLLLFTMSRYISFTRKVHIINLATVIHHFDKVLTFPHVLFYKGFVGRYFVILQDRFPFIHYHCHIREIRCEIRTPWSSLYTLTSTYYKSSLFSCMALFNSTLMKRTIILKHWLASSRLTIIN